MRCRPLHAALLIRLATASCLAITFLLSLGTLHDARAGIVDKSGNLVNPPEPDNRALILSFAMGVATPVGDFSALGFDTSAGLSVRIGKAYYLEDYSVATTLKIDAVSWREDIEDRDFGFFHLGGDLRFFKRRGTLLPYVSLGLGVDAMSHTKVTPDNAFAFGVQLGLGCDVLVSESVAVTTGLTLHPGFVETLMPAEGEAPYPTVRFVGLWLGVTHYINYLDEL